MLNEAEEMERLDLLELNGQQQLMNLPSFIENSLDYTNNNSYSLLSSSTPKITQQSNFSIIIPNNLSQDIIQNIQYDSQTDSSSSSQNKKSKSSKSTLKQPVSARNTSEETDQNSSFENDQLQNYHQDIYQTIIPPIDTNSHQIITVQAHHSSAFPSSSTNRTPFSSHVPNRTNSTKSSTIKPSPTSTTYTRTRLPSLPSLPATPISLPLSTKQAINSSPPKFSTELSLQNTTSIEIGRHVSGNNSLSINDLDNFLDPTQEKEFSYQLPLHLDASNLSNSSFQAVSTTSLIEERVASPRIRVERISKSSAAVGIVTERESQLLKVNLGLVQVNRAMTNVMERVQEVRKAKKLRLSGGKDSSVEGSLVADSTVEDGEETADSEAEVASRLQAGRSNYSARLQDFSLELNPTLSGTNGVMEDKLRLLEQKLARFEITSARKDAQILELQTQVVESNGMEESNVTGISLEERFKVELELKDALASIATLEDANTELEREVFEGLQQVMEANSVNATLSQDLLARQNETKVLQDRLAQTAHDFDMTHAQLLVETAEIHEVQGEEVEQLKEKVIGQNQEISLHQATISGLTLELQQIRQEHQGCTGLATEAEEWKDALAESEQHIRLQEKEIASKEVAITSLTSQLSKITVHSTKARSPLANEVFNHSSDLIRLEEELEEARAFNEQLQQELLVSEATNKRNLELSEEVKRDLKSRLNASMVDSLTPRKALDESIFYKSIAILRTPATPGLFKSNVSAWSPLGNLSANESNTPIFELIQELEAQVASLQAQLTLANCQLDAKINALEPAGSGSIKIAEELVRARARIAELEAQLRLQAQNSDSLEDETAELREVHDHLVNGRQEHMNRISELTQDLQIVKEELSSIQLEYSRLEEEYSTLEETLEITTADRDDLRLQLPSLKSELDQLRRESDQVGLQVSNSSRDRVSKEVETQDLRSAIKVAQATAQTATRDLKRYQRHYDREVHTLGSHVNYLYLALDRETEKRNACLIRAVEQVQRIRRIEFQIKYNLTPKITPVTPRARFTFKAVAKAILFSIQLRNEAATWKATKAGDAQLRKVAYTYIRGHPYPHHS